MKILYAIQGTGNGHISRARDIIPILQKKAQLDILISGTQCDLHLPYPIKYQLKGLSFVFGKKGGVDLVKTYSKSRLRNLLDEICNLPVENYDLIINDFEPVSAWACKLKNKSCYSLSHQSAVLNIHSPQPKHIDVVGKSILRRYAPTTAEYGFHFSDFSKNIYTPVIRKQVRDIIPVDGNHYTVYLPAYSDKRIIKMLTRFDQVQWEVFSKHTLKGYSYHNVSVSPVDNDRFLSSMASATGILCGAGFETPAEALFLKKKMLVIPMKGQYEQHCNAAALRQMGVPVIKNLKHKRIEDISDWLSSSTRINVDYPDITEEIIDRLLHDHTRTQIIPEETFDTPLVLPLSRMYTLKKILSQLAG